MKARYIIAISALGGLLAAGATHIYFNDEAPPKTEWVIDTDDTGRAVVTTIETDTDRLDAAANELSQEAGSATFYGGDGRIPAVGIAGRGGGGGNLTDGCTYIDFTDDSGVTRSVLVEAVDKYGHPIEGDIYAACPATRP